MTISQFGSRYRFINPTFGSFCKSFSTLSPLRGQPEGTSGLITALSRSKRNRLRSSSSDSESESPSEYRATIYGQVPPAVYSVTRPSFTTPRRSRSAQAKLLKSFKAASVGLVTQDYLIYNTLVWSRLDGKMFVTTEKCISFKDIATKINLGSLPGADLFSSIDVAYLLSHIGSGLGRNGWSLATIAITTDLWEFDSLSK